METEHQRTNCCFRFLDEVDRCKPLLRRFQIKSNKLATDPHPVE